MSKTIVALLVLAAVLGALPAVARADSLSLGLDLDLKLERDGFRVGGSVTGLQGGWGAWLSGRSRERGMTLDGRIEGDGRAFDFKLDTDVHDRVSRPRPRNEI